MIILTYIGGMPVHMIEHVLRNFTKEYEYDKDASQLDGTLYRFLRPDTKVEKAEDIPQAIEIHKNSDAILQIYYPSETVHADQIIKTIQEHKTKDDKHVFLVCEDLASAELIYLLFYYRLGITQWRGLDQMYIDCTENAHHWNPEYTDWSLMQEWELRECFSLCYPGIADEWIDAVNHCDDSVIKLNFKDLFHKPKSTLKKLIADCNLTMTNEDELDSFLSTWLHEQKKELEEFQLIEMIVDAVINDQPLDWETLEPNAGQFLRGDTKLSTVSEAIIQQKLRSRGYEILCSGLNEFPTNSKFLKSVAKKIEDQ